MTKAVVSKMKESRDGHIIFVNSAAGQCPIWGYTAYGATKFAVRGFAEALHMELLPYNVQVSIIYPPNTNTEGYQVQKFSDCNASVIGIIGNLLFFFISLLNCLLLKNLERYDKACTLIVIQLVLILKKWL